MNLFEFNHTLFYNPKHLHNQLINLEDKVKSLIINKRNKRGLVDGLGNVIKKITGNMDNDDAIEINEQIRNLQNNEILIKNNANDQTKLNSEMIQRFENITKFINLEQAKLQSITRSIKSFPHIEQQLFQTQVYFSMQSQISTFSDHVDSIINSIQLAKLGILSKHILTKSEIKIVRQSLQNQFETLNDENIYELLQLKAYFNNGNIVFAVQIPQTLNSTFKTIRLRSFPENNQIIKSKSNYLVYNPDQYSFIEKPCIRIEQIYLCNPLNLQNTSTNECEVNILENKPAKCSSFHTKEQNFIEEIENNHIIACSNQPINVSNTCGKNVTNFIGKLYISFSKCQIFINNIVYGDLMTSVSNFHIEQIFYNTLQITHSSKNNDFESLQMQHLDNTKELKLVKYQNQLHIGTNVSILLILIFCVLIHFIYKRYKIKNQDSNIASTTLEDMELQTVANHPNAVKLPS